METSSIVESFNEWEFHLDQRNVWLAGRWQRGHLKTVLSVQYCRRCGVGFGEQVVPVGELGLLCGVVHLFSFVCLMSDVVARWSPLVRRSLRRESLGQEKQNAPRKNSGRKFRPA